MPKPVGRTVLVLGASRGLGRAIAISAAEAGFSVVLGCRNADDGSAAVQQLQARGLSARTIHVDVADYAMVEAAVGVAAEWGQGLAGIVNNAGAIRPIGRIATTDPSDWARSITVNLTGAYHGTRAGLPRLLPGGVIINVSSGVSQSAVDGWSAYCASKAGLAMLTRSTHLEYNGSVRVYGVQPGMVDTNMQAQIRASQFGPISQVPRHKLSDANSPARAIVWLLRNAPDDLSGTEVDVDATTFLLRMGSLDTL